MGKIIALLTDFGLKDGYIAVMKGVIKSIAPNTDIIDITHDISPQNIDEAAYVLWTSYKYFPKSTIFVTVVDPGVGSNRKILMVKTKNYIFLAPDNGILKYIFAYQEVLKIYNLENKEYFLKNISNTFHGRDIFSPVAAYISKGIPLKNFGTETTPLTRPEYFLSLASVKNKSINGKILYIDRFGNIITNILIENNKYIDDIQYIEIGKTHVNHFYKYYSEARNSKIFGLVGSSNLLELAMRNQNAAKIYKVKIGTKIKVVLR
ncbi:MAG: hypothetical protein IGBAC_1687 [Ignavibacteriae bacterium]|nr:MAG: hypothetical protein IGBAC_1687 [Ignavibacteriota bacterium]